MITVTGTFKSKNSSFPYRISLKQIGFFCEAWRKRYNETLSINSYYELLQDFSVETLQFLIYSACRAGDKAFPQDIDFTLDLIDELSETEILAFFEDIKNSNEISESAKKS